MSLAGRKRLSPVARRALIEDAAARVFARDGYEAARMDVIAAAAGVTKPMLYRHFASKQELHAALLIHHRDALAMAALTPFMDTSRPLDERIEAMLDAWFAYVEEHPYVGPLLFRSSAADPDIRALIADLHARQRAADIALFHEAGVEIPEALAQPLAEIVRSSLTGLALWWADNPDVPRSVLVEAMQWVVGAVSGGRLGRG